MFPWEFSNSHGRNIFPRDFEKFQWENIPSYCKGNNSTGNMKKTNYQNFRYFSRFYNLSACSNEKKNPVGFFPSKLYGNENSMGIFDSLTFTFVIN